MTRTVVQKERHQLHLLAGPTIVRSYTVALGSGGLGQKLYEGDKVTPIGDYKITGSAIAIHGHRRDQPERVHKVLDWTLGCVSLDNDEIDEVASAVEVGTPVTIEP